MGQELDDPILRDLGSVNPGDLKFSKLEIVTEMLRLIAITQSNDDIIRDASKHATNGTPHVRCHFVILRIECDEDWKSWSEVSDIILEHAEQCLRAAGVFADCRTAWLQSAVW